MSHPWHRRTLKDMRFLGIALLIAMMCACAPASKPEESQAADINAFDRALAEFQKHITQVIDLTK